MPLWGSTVIAVNDRVCFTHSRFLVLHLPDHVLTDLEFYPFFSTNFTSNNYSNYVTLFLKLLVIISFCFCLLYMSFSSLQLRELNSRVSAVENKTQTLFSYVPPHAVWWVTCAVELRLWCVVIGWSSHWTLNCRRKPSLSCAVCRQQGNRILRLRSRCAIGWEGYSVGIVYYIPSRRVFEGEELLDPLCGADYGRMHIPSRWVRSSCGCDGHVSRPCTVPTFSAGTVCIQQAFASPTRSAEVSYFVLWPLCLPCLSTPF